MTRKVYFRIIRDAFLALTQGKVDDALALLAVAQAPAPEAGRAERETLTAFSNELEAL